MRKSAILFAAVMFPAAFAPNPATAQVTASQLQEIVSIIERGDAASFAVKDATIDYLPNGRTIYLPAAQAIALFNGCHASAPESADNSHGMTMLRFECPDRAPPAQCVTGELDLMVQGNFAGVNIAVSEVSIMPWEKPECRLAAPPPPSKEGGA